MQMTRFFTDRPGFRGIYSSNTELINGRTTHDLFTAALNPEEVLVSLEWYIRDDLKARFGSLVEVI
jgi:hypothetical protein